MIRARGPGRVNLIGEHTDYNDGLALPFAIDRGVTVTAEPAARVRGPRGGPRRARRVPIAPGRGRGLARVRARRWSPSCAPPATPSSPLPAHDRGRPPAGLGAVLLRGARGGAGLRARRTDPGDRRGAGQAVQRAWRTTGSAPRTGLLDQLAVLCGEDGHALRIDFRTLEMEQVPLDLGDWTARDARLRRLARARRAAATTSAARSAEKARELLGLDSLRDAPADPGPARAAQPPRPPRRHRERPRRRDDRRAAPPATSRPRASCSTPPHASLRDDYEASVPEVEATVAALKDAGAAGARMVGGGFGGSVLALLPPGARRLPGALVVAPGPAARGSESDSSSLSGRIMRPPDEERADDQHRQAGPQVDVDAGGLVDLRLGVGDARRS